MQSVRAVGALVVDARGVDHGIGGVGPHDLAVIAYSPIAKGRVKSDETLIEMGRRYGKSSAQICLRWLVQQNVVAIPRTSKIERLSENIDVFDFTLSDDDMASLFAMGSKEGRITDFGFAPQWD